MSRRPATPPTRATTRRSLLLSSLASAGSLFALDAAAFSRVPVSPPAHGWSLADLEVVDREAGVVLPVYQHAGNSYVPGRPGARYALRLRNRSPARLLVVLSVDGVNVISGATAAWNQVGYVLGPWQQTDITGWRKSDREVAAFEFSALEQSYAARTGRPDNVGVIGMAVFRERPPPVPQVSVPEPADTRKGRLASAPAGSNRDAAPSAAPAAERAGPAARADAAGGPLGTAHGDRETSVSRRTAFERAQETPDQRIELAYDSEARLMAAGVIPAPGVIGRARPFPRSPGDFVPDPPRW
jgi:hypothetical protein